MEINNDIFSLPWLMSSEPSWLTWLRAVDTDIHRKCKTSCVSIK